MTQIEFFSAPHANSFCQEKSLNQVSDSQNTYLQSTRERQLKSQFYTWNQQHVLHTTDHHSANFYTDLGRFCPVPFLPGKARKRLGKNCHEKYCSVYYYYFFLNSYCTYFVLTLEATEWGSPRNLSDAVTSLQEYFTFKILGFTSVTSTLLLAITPGIIINPEENTGNIFPS